MDTNVGLASFSSSQFSVDANGFVTFTGTPTPLTLTGTSGGAIASVANNFNILGAAVAASSTPVSTTGTAGTITVDVQRASAAGSSVANNAGLSSYNSTFFSVDANGYVTLVASSVTETLTGDSGGILSPTAGNFNILAAPTGLSFSGVTSTLTLGGILKLANGGTNAALTANNGGIFYSTATAGAILAGTATARQMLQSGSSTAPAWSSSTWPASTTINQILFSSATNTVTGLTTANNGVLTTGTTGIPVITALASDGQLIIGSGSGAPAAATISAGTGVTITNAANSITIGVSGSGVGQTITGNSGGSLSPSSGNWNIFGSTTIAGSAPLVTSGSGSTLTIVAQRSQAIASTDSTKIGMAAFNSAQFSVDANGFVTFLAGPNTITLTGTSGGPLVSSSFTLTGGTVAAGTTPVAVAGSGTTLTTNVQRSQALAAADSTKVGLSNFNSTYFSVDANGFVGLVAGSASITLTGDSGGPLVSSAFTITGGSSGLTFAGASSTETLTGTLIVGNGGTGVATMTTAYAPVCAGTTATGALQVASTGLSSSGYVLTSTGSSSLPTFQAPSAVGASLVLIQAKTASSSASLTFTSGISTYNDIMILVEGVYAGTSGASLNMTISTNGGSSYASTNYQSGINYCEPNTTTLTNIYSGSFIPISGPMNNGGSAYFCSATLWMYNLSNYPHVSGTVSFYHSSGFNTMGFAGGGSAGPGINALSFQYSSGNIAGGTIAIYGLRTS